MINFSLIPSPTCAESTPDYRKIKTLSEKLALHFIVTVASGTACESWHLVLGEAHWLGQDDAEAIEKSSLRGVWLGYAAQANLAVRCGRQDDVLGLNARELFQDGARGIAEPCALLPHLEALPQHEGKKADEDMSLHTILALVPDRTDIELIFLDA